MAQYIEAPPPHLVDRQFLAMLGVSLALHAAVLAWNRDSREVAPMPPVLMATLRAPQSVPREQIAAPRAEQVAAEQTRSMPERTAAREPERKRQRLAVDAPASPAQPSVAAASEPAKEPVVAAAAPVAATVPVAEPGPPPKPVPSQANLLDAYGRKLAGLFSQQQEYPRIAAMRGWEGEVLVRLRVARKGNLLGVHLDRSSGFEVLDQHAVSMVEHLSALPPLPEGVEGNEVQVVVPVSYKLKKAG